MFTPTSAFSGYSINDLAAAQDFYTNILGLKVEDNGMGLHFTLPGGGVVFMYPKTDHVPATFTVLNFEVASINEAVDALVAKGVVFERYNNLPAPQDDRGILRGIAANQGPDIAWFKDPSGNIISVLQSK